MSDDEKWRTPEEMRAYFRRRHREAGEKLRRSAPHLMLQLEEDARFRAAVEAVPPHRLTRPPEGGPPH